MRINFQEFGVGDLDPPPPESVTQEEGGEVLEQEPLWFRWRVDPLRFQS